MSEWVFSRFRIVVRIVACIDQRIETGARPSKIISGNRHAFRPQEMGLHKVMGQGRNFSRGHECRSQIKVRVECIALGYEDSILFYLLPCGRMLLAKLVNS